MEGGKSMRYNELWYWAIGGATLGLVSALLRFVYFANRAAIRRKIKKTKTSAKTAETSGILSNGAANKNTSNMQKTA